MKKYVPIIFNTNIGREVKGFDIYADDDVTHDEVVNMYCEKNGFTLGEVNSFGGKLLRIEYIEGDKRVLMLSEYLTP